MLKTAFRDAFQSHEKKTVNSRDTKNAPHAARRARQTRDGARWPEGNTAARRVKISSSPSPMAAAMPSASER
jgi:hypothetical protein